MQIHHFTWQGKSSMQIMHNSHEEWYVNNKQQYPKIELAQACLHVTICFVQTLRLYLHLPHNINICCKSLKIGNITFFILIGKKAKAKLNKTKWHGGYSKAYYHCESILLKIYNNQSSDSAKGHQLLLIKILLNLTLIFITFTSLSVITKLFLLCSK